MGKRLLSEKELRELAKVLKFLDALLFDDAIFPPVKDAIKKNRIAILDIFELNHMEVTPTYGVTRKKGE